MAISTLHEPIPAAATQRPDVRRRKAVDTVAALTLRCSTGSLCPTATEAFIRPVGAGAFGSAPRQTVKSGQDFERLELGRKVAPHDDSRTAGSLLKWKDTASIPDSVRCV